jgi:hypothetical protein
MTVVRVLWLDPQASTGDVVLRGVVQAVAFGLFMAGYARWMDREALRPGKAPAGEVVARHGLATGFRGTGGWLYLTDQRLLFRSHGLSFRTVEHSVPLHEIVDVQPARTWGLVPNALRVVTAGRTLRLTVEDRAGWLDAIRRARPPAPGTAFPRTA